MFKDLHEKILNIFAEDHHRKKSSDNTKIITNAVKNAKFQLGPAFVGFLKLSYQDHCSQHDCTPILQSGLALLENYLYQWRDFLKTKKSSLWFSKQEQSILQIDWSNIGDALYYIGRRQSTDVMPTQLLKYLIELWYSHSNTGEAGISSVGFKLQAPNLSLVEEAYITYLSKMKRGYIDLWNIENDRGSSYKNKRSTPLREEETLTAGDHADRDILEDDVNREGQNIRENDTIMEAQNVREDENIRKDESLRGHENVVSMSNIPPGDETHFHSGLTIDGNESVSNSDIIAKMKTQKGLWEKYCSFFDDFERRVSNHYEGIHRNPPDTLSTGLNKLALGEQEVSNVITVAKNQITTSFMFILMLAQTGQKVNQSLERIWENGWAHLETYFERWKDYILSNKAPIKFYGSKNSVKRIDWSQASETVRYMAMHNQQNTIPSQILSYLIDRSYSDVVEL
ncbi:uncharacterized protein MELLADRAFT_58380 [Melampsora larici-populina 98AG31]|uniref:Uncharacterized protein n=1 Tax=Melampsora larici-populina (strain 98AG31 / pathotype 3-4-7) TaxID=747676 RepID=F4R3B1_MELLP|nr:uncharacterized protein MELLADRAFT_58380 [Melampsora larici-populina 98AG31]EGG13200.1 hypothetical protein MELLADRAFT_58380 [Melampsora larici-populina 98AG31]